MGLPVSTDLKDKSYNLIFVIVDKLTKMINYKPVKITINILGLAKIIIDIVIWHYLLPDSIITDRGSHLHQNSGPCYIIS